MGRRLWPGTAIDGERNPIEIVRRSYREESGQQRVGCILCESNKALINSGSLPKSARGRIDLGDVTVHNIKQLKRLNQVVFPVAYNDKFYKDVLEVGELAKLAYFNDIVVGAVCCREDKSDGCRRLYIMTLGCLAPYRRLGIGSKMLEHVLKICEQDGNYDNVYLHVQVNNEDAVKFYEHFGFEIVERNENYYKRIEPADAFVLQKTFKDGANVCVKCDQSKDIMEDSIENKENILNKKS
ncbi:hypothetical protein LSH36_287g05017 [Paralvinella palmiformis]|uniref:N-terminal methionine N(alpha)-acetyltransferase NatE n=1 Tax=Paralvinella palmiformis TaxID=53620 RepID=A0AAD9JJC6_9ANNE|nr:hypothetical protein LSH36_287g05017 [Paralvinella palmiformis]